MRVWPVLECLFNYALASLPVLLLSDDLKQRCVEQIKEVRIAVLLHCQQVAVHFAHGLYQESAVVRCVQDAKHRVPHRFAGLENEVPNTGL